MAKNIASSAILVQGIQVGKARPGAARHLRGGALPRLAAIDIGTNSVRIKIVRVLPGGRFETFCDAREPVRPGEGVFDDGRMSPAAQQRLVSALVRYAALVRRHHAVARVVATSALREARNADEVIARIRKASGLMTEVITGQEEARLICLGVLRGRESEAPELVIDIGGGSTEVALADEEKPFALWSVALGAVRLGEIFGTAEMVKPRRLSLIRRYAAEVLDEALPRKIKGAPKIALGSSGSIRSVVQFASNGMPHATAEQLSRAVILLSKMSPEKRRRAFDPRRADIIIAGAAVLEALVEHLKLDAVVAVEAGLRDGVLVDLLRREQAALGDYQRSQAATNGKRAAETANAAFAFGRRLGFADGHAEQVRNLALVLFDRLARLHGLPTRARSWLEIAAILHDVGHAVSYSRHHKHTQYLILNADLPGLDERERELVSRVARFHRRSPPELGHLAMEGLTRTEQQQVRRLAVLLRLADALDRSHAQVVKGVRVAIRPRRVMLSPVIGARGKRGRSSLGDLERWDAEREAELFEAVFGRKLKIGGAGRERSGAG